MSGQTNPYSQVLKRNQPTKPYFYVINRSKRDTYRCHFGSKEVAQLMAVSLNKRDNTNPSWEVVDYNFKWETNT
jgi:predicted DNA-binding helix-hairpin-helix protein